MGDLKLSTYHSRSVAGAQSTLRIRSRGRALKTSSAELAQEARAEFEQSRIRGRGRTSSAFPERKFQWANSIHDGEEFDVTTEHVAPRAGELGHIGSGTNPHC